MKYVVVALVIAVVWWLWRQGRDTTPKRSNKGNTYTPHPPQAMVQCAVCHVHLPVGEATWLSRDGSYRCSEHAPKPGA